MHILVAEDDPILQRMIEVFLSRRGISFRLVANGKSAVQAWEAEKFDLIFMDIQMPGVDGLEATRIIRQRERETGEHVPIVAMTAHALSRDREISLQAGMDDYISKPVVFEDLEKLIEKYSAGNR